jgi:hypothetical protein
MLALHLWNIGRRVRLEIPAFLQISVRADFANALFGIDDVHLRPRPVHQDRADRAHIIIDPINLAPMARQLALILERWRCISREHLDGLVIDPVGIVAVCHDAPNLHEVQAARKGQMVGDAGFEPATR